MARTITFIVNKKTHEQSVHIDGVKGTECDAMQAKLEAFFGKPDDVKITEEYHQQPAQTGAKAGY